MKKNPDAAMRRKEKRQAKNQKQIKAMAIICIIAAVIVAAIAVIWAITGVRAVMNRDLTAKEMHKLFESDKNIPSENDPMIGSWYFYHNDTIIGKYVLDANGKMAVYDWSEQGYNIKSLADYRVRPKAGKLYVKPDGGAKVVVYDYTIEPVKDREDVYIMRWTYDNQTWTLVKIVME